MDTSAPIDNEVAVSTHAPDLYRYDATPQRIARLADIGPEEVAFFHAEGYLVVDEAFTPAQAEAALAAVHDLIDGVDPTFRGVQLEAEFRGRALDVSARRLAVRKLMGYVDYDERFQNLAADPVLMDVLARLMDDEPVLFQDMALLKPPGGREKPWHQDCAYFNFPLGTTVIGIWISLDEATPENGCLHIMPGTHREGPIEHFKRRDWQICDTEVPKDRDVVVPLKPGGGLIWHGMLHHGSPYNQSQQIRRALQFHYRPNSAGKTTTEERMLHFGGEVRGAEC